MTPDNSPRARPRTNRTSSIEETDEILKEKLTANSYYIKCAETSRRFNVRVTFSDNSRGKTEPGVDAAVLWP
jgi:hypothetical protein